MCTSVTKNRFGSLETVITVIKQTYPSTWSDTVTFKVKKKSTCSKDKCFTKLCFYPHFTCTCKYRSSNTQVDVCTAVSADRIIDVDVGMLDTSVPGHFGTCASETFRHQDSSAPGQFGTCVRHFGTKRQDSSAPGQFGTCVFFFDFTYVAISWH